MLRLVKPLHGYVVLSEDGAIGRVHDLYFHDDTWLIRYLVVDTGRWLSGRKVLIRPDTLRNPDWESHSFSVALTKEQIEKSPEIDTDKPVSRQQEVDLHKHFGWKQSWLDPGPAGWLPVEPEIPDLPSVPLPGPTAKQKADPHLRSAREVTGYHIHASDGELGHVIDFIADDARWIIRYLVVNLHSWLPTRRVLLSPEWLGGISYEGRRVEVALTQEKVLNCPEFHPTAGVNREYEERIYDYYGRPTYWIESKAGGKGRR